MPVALRGGIPDRHNSAVASGSTQRPRRPARMASNRTRLLRRPSTRNALPYNKDWIARAIFGPPTWVRTRALRKDGQSPPKIARPGATPD